MSRDPAEVASHWLRWAAEDLALAARNAADHDVVARGACLFAHQAAEKALKALLAARGIDPPKLRASVKWEGPDLDASKNEVAAVELQNRMSPSTTWN